MFSRSVILLFLRLPSGIVQHELQRRPFTNGRKHSQQVVTEENQGKIPQKHLVLFGLAESSSVAVVGRLRPTTRVNQKPLTPPCPAPLVSQFQLPATIGAPVRHGKTPRTPPPSSEAQRRCLRRLRGSHPEPDRRWPPGRRRRRGRR